MQERTSSIAYVAGAQALGFVFGPGKLLDLLYFVVPLRMVVRLLGPNSSAIVVKDEGPLQRAK